MKWDVIDTDVKTNTRDSMKPKTALLMATSMAAMSASSGMSGMMDRESISSNHIPKHSYLRKKCKSCKNYRGTYCISKSYITPMMQACEQYN